MSQCCTFRIHQIFVLLKKNFWLCKRTYILTFLQLFVPFAFMLILFLLQYLYTSQGQCKFIFIYQAPILETIKDLPKCTGQDCKTILYSPNDNPSVDFIMSYIAYYNTPQLKFGKNFSDETLDVVGMKNESVLLDYILGNPNKTFMAVSFEMTRAPLFNVYTVLFNSSSRMLERVDTISPLVYSLDRAFCKF